MTRLYILVTGLSKSVYSFMYKVLARLWHGCDMVVTWLWHGCAKHVHNPVTSMSQPCWQSCSILVVQACYFCMGEEDYSTVVETLAFDNWCKNSGWNWRNQKSKTALFSMLKYTRMLWRKLKAVWTLGNGGVIQSANREMWKIRAIDSSTAFFFRALTTN